MRAMREKKKQMGYKIISASIPEEYKKILDKFCLNTKLTISELICYILGCLDEGDFPEIEHPIDFEKY